MPRWLRNPMELRSGRWFHPPPGSPQPSALCIPPSQPPLGVFNILEASRLTPQLLSSQGPVPQPTIAEYWDLEQNLAVTIRPPHPQPFYIHSATKGRGPGSLLGTKPPARQDRYSIVPTSIASSFWCGRGSHLPTKPANKVPRIVMRARRKTEWSHTVVTRRGIP